MFIGRKKELKALQETYEQKGFSMTVISGRRRIGKSALIVEFIKDKKAVFYTATKVGAERNLELFSQQVLSLLDPAYMGVSINSPETIFDIITDKVSDAIASEKKLIIVIDELPYWAEKSGELLSVIQKYIDTKWSDKNIMLILCGSALSFMEQKVLSEKSPLFGRRTSQIRLEAFDYRDSAKFVPFYSNEDKAICYGVTGGVAKYLALFDPQKSLDENIKRLFFRKDGYLFDETKNLLIQEFSDITLINNIIEQIAHGETLLNNIASKMGEKDTTVLYSLERLIEVGLAGRRRCITEEKNKKKTQYVLRDSMFKFWYAFIPKAISVIEIDKGEIYYDKVVKPALHSYMGSVFEDMCRYYTLEQGIEGKFGGFITQVGTYWGIEQIKDEQGTVTRLPADIDVVALSDIDRTAVIGECKFRNEKIDKGIFDVLQRRARLITGRYQVSKYLLFSLSGFTDWFDEMGREDTLLITLDDMYKG